MSPGRFITGIFIDAHGRDVCNVAVRDELSCYYDLIGCDLIDIVRAKIGESTVAIVCDDEGKLRDNPVITGVVGTTIFVGSLFICAIDSRGEFRSLKKKELSEVRSYITMDEGQPVLVCGPC